MSADLFLEAVGYYNKQLLEYFERYPDSPPDELVSTLDHDVMSYLPLERDLFTADPQQFEQFLMDEVPLRNWESMADLSERPTIGWMMNWVMGDHVRVRALTELRVTLDADDWRVRVIDEMLVVE